MPYEGGFKRKDLDVDFAADYDFSLSPALKIRRLDTEESVLPMMDEDGTGPATYHQSAAVAEDEKSAPVVVMDEPVLPPPPPQSENPERALVLFRPVNVFSPSNYSVALDSQLLSSLNRDQLLSSGQPFEIHSAENQISDDGCKAVVPWVSQQPLMQGFQTEESQNSMEPDEDGVVSMDVEDSEGNGNMEPMCQFYNAGVPQLQQHCLIPELPRNNLTPVILLR
ncbi:hypothetical protein LINGRAHAP2_LOCUS21343 [Linum grandiflorum]